MYKTILVPLDGSKLAEAVLPHVTELANLFGATVVFLCVIELPHLVDLPRGEGFEALPQVTADEVRLQVDEVEAYLNRKASELGAAGITARARIEYGPIVATIMKTARYENADLIAMASHGRGGLTDVYYGSVAAGVLQRIDRPLLIVRAQGNGPA